MVHGDRKPRTRKASLVRAALYGLAASFLLLALDPAELQAPWPELSGYMLAAPFLFVAVASVNNLVVVARNSRHTA